MPRYLALVIALLSGCGGGGGGGATSSPIPQTPSVNIDTEAPVINAPADISLSASNGVSISVDSDNITVFLNGASATDNVDASVTVNNDAPDFFPVGINTVTFSAVDAAGNEALTVTAVVTITDSSLGDNDLAGKVIDGYISGATAFLDLNFNGTKDDDEPSAISGTNGDFSFQLTDSELQCASYVPTVVDIPVGAIDSEFGAVTEAFQMILPPKFEALTENDALNVSPITSLVWNAIESQLQSQQLSTLSCTTIKASQSEREQLVSILNTAISDVVTHYNLAADKLFIDFIAEDNSAVKEVAVTVVKGLKKSLDETSKLQTQYPEATWAKINYYFFSSLDGGALYPNAWYRDVELYNGDTITKELIKVSDDLTQELRPIIYEKTTVSTVNGIALREEIGYESRGGDSSTYSCSYKEEASIVVSAIEYQLVNLGNESNVSNVQSCQLPDFATKASSRNIFYRSIVDGVDSGAQFTFVPESGNFPALNDWVNLVENIESLTSNNLVIYVEGLPYGFCESGYSGATAVNRSRTETIDGIKINLNRSESGIYERVTTFANGTSETDISTIDSSPGWDTCDQVDSDNDGSPNLLDPDDDNDGVPDLADAFPFNASESVDTDGDSIGNNTDTDDDNDGLLDNNDEFPLDAGNVLDSDADGVVDRDDVAPNDASISKALKLNLSDAAALGLGEAINSTANNVAALPASAIFLQYIFDFLITESWADGDLEALTNLISWDESGAVVLDTIRASETFYIAEVNLSPDGKSLYLLTSAHIQRAIPNLDQEVCSIYRVSLEDYSFKCLLQTEDGDIQPRSLNPSIALDFSRGNMTFRSDGSALLHGFNWVQLEADPLAQAALGSIWMMAPDGTLSAIDRENGFEVNLAVWISDNYFASHEWFIDENYSISQERIAVYNASTLERVKLIDANGASQGIVKFNADLYWSSGSLDGASLELQDNPVNGLPVVDEAAKRLYSFANTNSPSNTIESLDGSIVLALTDGQAGNGGYNYQKQSGVGTDIKYSAFSFTEEYIGYMKVYAPTTPITSIDGASFVANQTIILSGARGTLEIQNYRDIFLITPSDDLVGDLVIDYVVTTDTGSETKQLTITEQTITNWRNDENGGDWLEWASPESEQEGFCVYAIATDTSQCVNFENYQVLTTDMEYFRSTRYDTNAVYSNESGFNAFPGIQNTLLFDGQVLVIFKDSANHQYYQAKASISDFMAQGESALAITSAVNGAGDTNIIIAATALEPLSPLALAGAAIDESATLEFTVDFGQPLSNYAPFPELAILNSQEESLPLARDIDWSTTRDTATIFLSGQGVVNGTEHRLQITDPIFVVDSTRRYELANDLTFTPSGVNAFQLSGSTVTLNDYIPSTQVSSVTLLSVVAGNSSMSVDLAASPLNLQNMENATSGGDFKTPTLGFALSHIPTGQGSVDVTIDILDGTDSIQNNGERKISIELTADWTADGIDASISVPTQTVSASYDITDGTTVAIEVDNLDSDMLSITAAGANYPATLNLKLLSALNKIQSLSPASLLSAGAFNINVTTTLPMVDSEGNAVTRLGAIVHIGD